MSLLRRLSSLRHPVASVATTSRCLSSSSSSSSSSSGDESSELVGWKVDQNISGCGLVGTITLKAASTYNALTVEMGEAFLALCTQLKKGDLEGSQDVTAIVLTGAGDDAFSAGGNLDWLRSLKHNSVHANADLMLKFYQSFLCIRTIPVPVIAAIHGPAMGAGACLALACDMRTAAPKSRILGFNFSRLGIHSGMGGSHLLQRALGGKSAILNEILLTGKVLSGQEALDLGLVNRLSPNAKAAAYDLAEQVALQHPVAVRTMLRTLRQRQDEGLEQALQQEAFAQAVCYARNDWGEGLDAVVDKRDPIFELYHSK
jgi:enoyl-CoA hydratase